MARKIAGPAGGPTDILDSPQQGEMDIADTDSGRRLHGDVLTRQRFLQQVEFEKRRADRSRAPLSLVVMRFTGDGVVSVNDLRDILTDLSLSTRETDLIGYLNDGLISFLLPYSDAKAAETFCNLVIDRIEAPDVTVDAATYTDARFDALLQESLTDGGADQSRVHHAVQKKIVGHAIKRLIDVVGAVVLLIVLSPVIVVTAIVVKLTSPGPIIFRQTRVGRGGVPFTFYKFRSMRIDGDDRVHREYVAKLIAGKHDEINQGDAANPVYKIRADPRITWVGNFIRKSSIDELPQLFNVLKGEMSLVGPRPPITYETEKYQSWHSRRLQEVRPGLTGMWQVYGRSRTSFDDMVRLDLRYIRNWSLWLDFKILLRTIIVVFRMDGAD